MFGCNFRDWREDFRSDCYYYSEDKDMGATIPWCCKIHKVIEPKDCKKDCIFYVSKDYVTKIVDRITTERDL